MEEGGWEGGWVGRLGGRAGWPQSAFPREDLSLGDTVIIFSLTDTSTLSLTSASNSPLEPLTQKLFSLCF